MTTRADYFAAVAILRETAHACPVPHCLACQKVNVALLTLAESAPPETIVPPQPAPADWTIDAARDGGDDPEYDEGDSFSRHETRAQAWDTVEEI